jgi:hypothetical protein
MHAWHIILVFGVLCGAFPAFVAGLLIGRWRTLRRMTLRGKPLDAIGSTYGLSRMVKESDASYRKRMRKAVTGGMMLLALAGCVHPQPVNPSSAPAAWFVVDDQVWYCDKAQVPLCRCFRGNER